MENASVRELPSGKPEISWKTVCYHFCKWCRDGSLRKVWHASIDNISEFLDISEISFDGTHAVAKKGGESVGWQGRRKAKTSNILVITDKNGNPLASTQIISGNHNDAYDLGSNPGDVFRDTEQRGLAIKGSYSDADAGSDTKEARKICSDHKVIPNIAENRRNRKLPRRGRKRLSDESVYKNRFGNERTSAWADKFGRIPIRFEHKDSYFYGFHRIAFAMICLRHVVS